jgi:hypothetical protein
VPLNYTNTTGAERKEKSPAIVGCFLKQGRWPIRGKRRAKIISEIIQTGAGKIFKKKQKQKQKQTVIGHCHHHNPKTDGYRQTRACI